MIKKLRVGDLVMADGKWIWLVLKINNPSPGGWRTVIWDFNSRTTRQQFIFDDDEDCLMSSIALHEK